MTMTTTTSRQQQQEQEELLDKFAPWGSGLKHGYTHLHMAMMSIASVAEIQQLIDLQHGQPNIDEASSPLLIREDKEGQTALHLAVKCCGYNPAITQTLLTACPDAAKLPDTQQRLPLHYAMEHNARLGVVIALLSAFPDAAIGKDDKGQTPLHIALIKGAETDDTIVKAMLDQCPMSSTIQYRDWTPLHWAAGSSSSERIIKALLQCFPEANLVKDKDSRLPLHVAMAMRASPKVIKILLGISPEVVTQAVDQDGLNPYQHGLRNKSPPESIRLVKQYLPEQRLPGMKKPYEY